MKKVQVNEIVEVNGVILTEKATAKIQMLQDENNAGIQEFNNHIGDVVCFLGELLNESLPEDITAEVPVLIKRLSRMRKDLSELKKP